VIEFGEARGRSSQPGVESWHCFSSGPYYDPHRISFGPIIGVDEHRVAAGAGFDWHAHAGVHIVTWVLEGVLRHEDSEGVVQHVPPGELFVQSTGPGVRHTETNASSSEPLRFVQVTLLADGPVGAWSARVPATVAGVRIDISPHAPEQGRAFVLPLEHGSMLVLELLPSSA
jgi:quercetin 2,3-dioxygenase